MFRTDIGADEGMLFPSREPMVRSFWMKNTPLSLDIIFIGPDRRIINIAANTTPYSRSEEHTSELQTLMRISYAVFCLKKKNESSTNSNNELLYRYSISAHITY